LGDELGITGTPGLLFANGRLVPGAIAKEDIEKLLDAK
jgi:thiol:disulfide interchange protein DsbC